MYINGTEIQTGMKVKFTLNSSNYTQYISGTIKGVVDYSIARVISDVINYHSTILNASSLPKPSALTYFILESDVTGEKIAYAPEWIHTEQFEVLEGTHTIQIKVFNVSLEDTSNILATLTELGYSTQLVV